MQTPFFTMIDQAILKLQLAAGALLLAVLVVIAIKTHISKSKKKTKIKSKAKASGVIFGKSGFGLACSPEADEGHVAVFGGSGLGKTTAVLIPTLRSWRGTAFIIDISGDICSNVDIPKRLIYEPENPHSAPYNIFAAVDEAMSIEGKNELLEQLAFLIIPDSPKDNDTSMFFKTEGRKILISALICYYHAGLDFIPICRKIIENGWRDLLNDIANHDNHKANQYISSFVGTNEQNTAGCKQVLDKALILLATSEKLKKTIRRPHSSEKSVSPDKLEQESVFVVLEDAKLKVYAPLLHIITAQSLEYMSKRPNGKGKTILFCLDEFASLGKMEMTDALRKLRKKRIRIMVLTQSMADIDLIYGRDERMAMMNNFAFKVVLGCDDTDTQEYFSKLIGEKTVIKTSISINDRTTTKNEREQLERICPPAELARLGNRLILLSPDGYLKLKKNFTHR